MDGLFFPAFIPFILIEVGVAAHRVIEALDMEIIFAPVLPAP